MPENDPPELASRGKAADELYELAYELVGKDMQVSGLRDAIALAQQVSDKSTEYQSLANHALREGGG